MKQESFIGNSFCKLQSKESEVKINGAEESAVFGIQNNATILNNQKQSPKQSIIQLLEQFCKIYAQAIAIQIIDQEGCTHAEEFLESKVINFQNQIYTLQQSCIKGKLLIEFDEAFIFIKSIIIKMIDIIKQFQQIVIKLTILTDQITFKNYVSCFPEEFLESKTIFYGKFENDKTGDELINLILSESQIIGRQLCLCQLKAEPQLSIFLLQTAIALRQQYLFRQKQYIQLLQNNYIYLPIISKLKILFPQIKGLLEQIISVMSGEKQEIEFKSDDYCIQVINLMADKMTQKVESLKLDLIIPNIVSQVIGYVLILIEYNNQEEIIVEKLEQLFSQPQLQQYFWMFNYLQRVVYSTQLRLLLQGFENGVVKKEFTKFLIFLIQDKLTLQNFIKTNEQFQQNYYKQMSKFIEQKINLKEYYQVQDFISILRSVKLIDKFQENQFFTQLLEQQISDSYQLSNIIIQKDATLLEARKQLQYEIETYLRYYSIPQNAYNLLDIYYKQQFNENKSLIITQSNKQSSQLINKQKQTEELIKKINKIQQSEQSDVKQYFPKPNLLKMIEESEEIQEISIILKQFQKLHQNKYLQEQQEDFINLLKEIKNYNDENKNIFESNIKNYIRPEFNEVIVELKQFQNQQLQKALELIKINVQQY